MGDNTETNTSGVHGERNSYIIYDSCKTPNYLYVSSQDYVEAEEQVKGSIEYKARENEQ